MLIYLLTLFAVTIAKNITTATPTWVTSNYFRAGYKDVISTLTGNASLPQFTFTFSSPLTATPGLAYGIKNYRGNDYLYQQFYQIRKIGLTLSTFSVQIQIYGATNLWILTVPYLAVEPSFPHHFNSFDNVPLNYSSGNIVNISAWSLSQTSFTQQINYQTQSTGRPYNTFTSPLSDNKIVLFITSLWTRSWSNPYQVHITTTIINSTCYKWTATAYADMEIYKLQFSQIIFNQKDVESSNKYYIVYEEWITDLNGGFKAIPIQFIDNFIMGITDFQTTAAGCGFQYQWQFANDTVTGQFGVNILRSWTKTNTCGFSWMRSSVFYIKTWICPPPYYYFNITSNLCQNLCDILYSQNTTNYTCQPKPCDSQCLTCVLNTTYFCTACNTSMYLEVSGGVCVCSNGFQTDNSTVQNDCIQICGDGKRFTLACDDGNIVNGDGCSATCTVQNYFICSGGNSTTASTCVQICGDGKLFTLACDDGNNVNGDGCSSTCTIQTGYSCSGGNNSVPSNCIQICGDGQLYTLACDDGNTVNGDGCSSTCTIEAGFTCSGGNSTAASSCVQICGDGKLYTFACDDGNTVNGDGCSSICAIQTGYSCSGGNVSTPSACTQICGDGLLFLQQCDDGNTANGDGCSSTCTIQTGYSCSGGNSTTSSTCVQICGDGILFTLPCDDGNLINGDGCSSTCSLETGFSCSGGSITNASICIQICGDGLLFTLPCDDGNVVDGDGCSSVCQVQSGYQCTGGNSTTSSVCTVLPNPNFQIKTYWKDPTSNRAIITLSIDDPTQLASISTLLTLNFPYETLSITADPITDLIKIQFTYSKSLNSQQSLSISFNRGTLSTTFILPETTDNDLTLKYYSSSFYNITSAMNRMSAAASYIAIALFIVGLFVSRLIAVQMIFVFQFTYCGLLTLKKLESLMDPLKALYVTNGYNAIGSDQIFVKLPPKISQIKYQAEFTSNFNLDFIVILLPPAVGLITYLLGRLITSDRTKKWGKRILKQITFTMSLFIIFQLIFAFILNMRFANNPGKGIFLGLMLLGIIVVQTVIFWKWPNQYGQYKYFFRQTFGCQNFYILIIFLRIFLSFFMVSLSESIASCVLSLIIILTWGILILFYSPYNSNIRPLGNNIMTLLISILFLYTRSQLDSPQVNFASTLPLIIISVLLLNLCFNLYYLIRHFIKPTDVERERKVDNKGQIQNTLGQLTFQQKSQKKDVQEQSKLKMSSLLKDDIKLDDDVEIGLKNISQIQFLQNKEQPQNRRIKKEKGRNKRKQRASKLQPNVQKYLSNIEAKDIGLQNNQIDDHIEIVKIDQGNNNKQQIQTQVVPQPKIPKYEQRSIHEDRDETQHSQPELFY